MRQLKFILAVALIACLSSCNSNETKTTSETTQTLAPASGSIVYFQLDSVVKHYDMYNDLSSELEAKAQKIQNELQGKLRSLQNDAKDFQNKIDKGLLTRAEAEERNQVLTNRQNDLQNLQLQRQQEMAEEEAVLYNKVMDAIRTYLEKMNKEKNYSAIIANSVIVGDPSLDITKDITEGLNNEYIKNKKSGKSAEKKTTEE